MKHKEKVKPLSELAGILDALRGQGKRIVLCHGVFDLLHIGHIRYLAEAKSHGDVLVATLTPDRFVDKGPGRPAFTEELRAESLASLDCVDFAAVNQWETAEETLRLLRPHVYVKGEEFRNLDDMTGKIGREAQAALDCGVELVFAGDIVFSSTNLINRYLSNLPAELRQYLDLFGSRFSLDDVLDALDAMASLKVLLVGDTILDEYQYCNAIGKSSKDPVLALSYQDQDLFAGGVLAVANHIANFAGRVDLFTVLGELERQEEFITESLAPNVRPVFLTKCGAPTTLKRRIVDGYTFTKLIEIYHMDDSPMSAQQEEQAVSWLRERAGDYDMVVVADFGHGMIGPGLASALSGLDNFLAVNTQANAGNRGFNTIGKYPRADFVSLAEHEMRLEHRDLNGGMRQMMENMAREKTIGHLVVTTGRRGCVVSGPGASFVKVPSFTSNVVDRVGAGDAFFSVGALASRLGLDPEIIGFLGNVAGSLAVQVIGNKRAIDRMAAKKYIKALLK